MALVERLMSALGGLRRQAGAEECRDRPGPAGEAAQAQALLDSIGDAVVSCDRLGLVSYLNRAAEVMTAWSRDDALGRPASQVLRIIDRDTRALVRSPMAAAMEMGVTVGLTGNCLLQRRDGREVAIEDSAAPVHDADGRLTGAIMVFRDVGAALFLSQEMARRAHHDPLTGLPNRLLMNDRLGEAVALGRRHGTLVAVLFVDVDRFKVLNDTLGHAVADEVLRIIGQRLRAPLRCTDTVSRYGGDEFVIVLPQIEHVRDAGIVAATLLRAMETPIDVGERRLHVTVSVGASIFPEHASDAETLLATADQAMYQAKRERRGSYRMPAPGAVRGTAPPLARGRP